MGKGDVGPEDVWRRQHLSLALKELRASAPAEREGDGGENYYCQTERGGGRGKGRESCLCVSACAVSVSVLTPAARPPSPLILWRALRSSGPFFFSLYLFPFIPRLHLLPLSLRSSSLHHFFLLALPFSPTMVQDFYRQGRRGALLTEVSWMDGWINGWMGG